jgi:hypothetical protein
MTMTMTMMMFPFQLTVMFVGRLKEIYYERKLFGAVDISPTHSFACVCICRLFVPFEIEIDIVIGTTMMVMMMLCEQKETTLLGRTFHFPPLYISLIPHSHKNESKNIFFSIL